MLVMFVRTVDVPSVVYVVYIVVLQVVLVVILVLLVVAIVILDVPVIRDAIADANLRASVHNDVFICRLATVHRFV